MSRVVGAVFLFCVLVPVQGRQDQVQEAATLLRQVRSLRCEFPSGALVKLTDTTFKRQTGSGGEAVFDNIDRSKRTARVVGNIGAEDVAVIVGAGSLTFVESGFEASMVNVTAVFARFRPGTRDFVAADSHHSLLHLTREGVPFAEQYYGSCRALQ